MQHDPANPLPTVRWATVGDAEAVAELLAGMARHYGQAALGRDHISATVRAWLAAESPAYPHFALAFRDGRPAGLASVAIMHPGVDLTRLLFVKDLFVAPLERDGGVGAALMRFLAQYCLDHGIGRLDLTTGKDNDGAQRLYLRLGATLIEDRVFLRFNGDALGALASGTGKDVS